MRPTLLLFLCALSLRLAAQPTFTANDIVPPLNITFGYGVNLGYFPPYYQDMELATLAHGSPDGKVPGLGATTIRPGLFEDFFEYWGYDIRIPHFSHYDSIGIRNIVAIAGFPSDAHRENAFFCPDNRSAVFKNLYEPIWDNGENGTPVNDENYYALYIWKTAIRYKGLIKIWEVWNEPDIDIGPNGWKAPGQPGNWWENPPEPCETLLYSPVFFYIRMLRISYEVLKTVDPNAQVAVGGLGSPAYLDVICRYTDEPFNGDVSTKYPHKGGAYFDVMSFHSYPHIDNSLREWDNSINGFRNFRHSDAATKGVWTLRDKFKTILEKYGYNAQTYPLKHWICSEFNVPRRAYAEYLGSNEAQANFMIKALVTAQEEGIAQMHVYSLSDERPEAQANGEFSFMGLYKNLNNVKPFEGEMTPAAFAYKTTATLLKSHKYNRVQTEKMQLPAGVRGLAFKNSLSEFTYVLWAETNTDHSEEASQIYAFPDALNLKFLDAKPWNFSQTGSKYLENAKQVRLTGSPVFLTPTQITGDYPKQPKVYPNPLTEGNGVYTFWMFEEGFAQVNLYNAEGRLLKVLVDELSLLSGPHAMPLDLSIYPRGTYMLQLITLEGAQSLKVVRD